MDANPNLARKLGLQYGSILGAALAVFVVTAYSLDIFGASYLSFVPMLLTGSAMVYACYLFKQAQGGYMTLGQGFRVGLTVAVVGATVQTIVSTIYTELIDSDAISRYLERMRIQLYQQGELPDEAIDMAMDWTEKLTAPAIAVPITIVSAAFTGAILALIIGAIMQKRPQA